MNIGLLGLGNMGAALGRCLAMSDNEVYGWSRQAVTRETARDYCIPCGHARDVFDNCQLIVICLPDYDSTMKVLKPLEEKVLSEKTLVQLSSGTPDEAREMELWSKSLSINYIDGAIATFPDRIGVDDTAIFFSGSRSAYEEYGDTLKALGGRNAFVSDKVTGAAALDLAWLSLYYGVSLGLLHGAAFCEAEGVQTTEFFSAMPSFMPEISHAANEYAEMISLGNFDGDQATLSVHLAAMQHLNSSAKNMKLDERFTSLLVSLYGDAISNGDGQSEIAATIKVIRKESD